jgi:hypothetical protein
MAGRMKPARFAFQSHGVRYLLDLPGSDDFAQLDPHLPPDWRPARGARFDYHYLVEEPREHGEFVLLRNGDEIVRRSYAGSLLEILEADIRFTLSLTAPRRTFIHAGVVGWDGGAILLPGRSRAGKSTLVAALVQAGATYYSDEFAVLDRLGRVHPFHKSISMRHEDGTPAREVPIDELGADVGEGPLPVALVAFTQYEAGASWAPKTLAPAQAMLRLLQHTMAARKRPEAIFPVLKRVAVGARALSGERGATETVVPALLAAAGHA